MKTKDTMFALRCHKDLIVCIDEVGKQLDINRSQFVRMCIILGLEKCNREKSMSKNAKNKINKTIDTMLSSDHI